MGEIADMIIEGGMCQWCGDILDGEPGYPRICSACQREHGVDEHGGKKPKRDRIPCEHCGKRITKQGMADHVRAKHAIYTVAPNDNKKKRMKRIAEIVGQIKHKQSAFTDNVRMVNIADLDEIYALATGRSCDET